MTFLFSLEHGSTYCPSPIRIYIFLVSFQFLGRHCHRAVVVAVRLEGRGRQLALLLLQLLLSLGLPVALHVEVHEEAEENGRIQQEQGGDEFRELALVAEEGAGGVDNAQHKLGLKRKKQGYI